MFRSHIALEDFFKNINAILKKVENSHLGGRLFFCTILIKMLSNF